MFTRERIRQIEAKALRKLRHPSRSRKAQGLPGVGSERTSGRGSRAPMSGSDPAPGARMTSRSSAAAIQHPAAMLYGPGHVVVHGTRRPGELFGAGWLGLAGRRGTPRPAAGNAFDLMDLVYREGRPLARAGSRARRPWRLTVAERRDPGTGDVYGIAIQPRPAAARLIPIPKP